MLDVGLHKRNKNLKEHIILIMAAKPSARSQANMLDASTTAAAPTAPGSRCYIAWKVR